jgi:pSer/pThr/pTyr-binding forkhead associated (FHA) protein
VADNRNIVGRALDSDIVLRVAEVSRRHALIVRRGSDVLLSDLGSANGTALNGIWLGAASERIVPGDRIRFGDTELSFRHA